MQLSIPESKLQTGSQVVSLYQQLLERIKGLPGVESVGATQALPLSESGGVRPYLIEGRPVPEPGKEPLAQYRIVTPDYFRTMGIKLLRGREFVPEDTEQAPGAIIVNETFARRNWPGEDPVGRRVRHGADPAQNPSLTVVGVVDNVRHFGLGTEADPEMYWAHAQVSLLNRPTLERWKRSMTLVARTSSDPANLVGAVRREVLSLDKDLPIYNVKTLEERLDKSLARPRFNTLLLAVFAAVALMLAAVGLYGVMYYSVTQRTHEIGLRMALGAQASDILRLVVGQGMALALAGVIIGVAAAFAVTRVMSSLLFGVEATDPATFAIISLLLIIVALVASYIPARRATKVDPMVVLRYE
jgi:predicted permease